MRNSSWIINQIKDILIEERGNVVRRSFSVALIHLLSSGFVCKILKVKKGVLESRGGQSQLLSRDYFQVDVVTPRKSVT